MGQVNVKFFGLVVEAAKKQTHTQANASTVRELLDNLSSEFGDGFRKKLFDPNGELQGFVNVFVNNTDVRHLKELDTPLKDGDEVLILPAVAGG
jgi:MoaD family protein